MNNLKLHHIVKVLILSGLILPPIIIYGTNLPRVETETISLITLSLFEQIVIFITAFIIKPVYEIISLLIVIMLWKKSESDLSALRRAMLAFFIGENACALNYLFFNERSLLMEYFHTYGMVVCFGLIFYALSEALDIRVFNFSNKEKKCALLPFCKRCYKYIDMRCNLRHMFLFVIPATAVLAVMPLTALIGSHFYIGKVFEHPAIFGQPVMYQAMEVRFYPFMSLPFFVLSFIFLLFLREKGFEGTKIFYSIGAGLLGFSLMRFFLYWGYQQNPLWADAWEEITEFLFVAFVLWLTLRIRAVTHQSDKKLPDN